MPSASSTSCQMSAPSNPTAPTAAIGRPIAEGQRATFTNTIRLKLRVPARLRNLELLLLIFASLINASAICLVQLGALGEIDSSLLTFGLGLAILTFAMHTV